MIPVTTDKYDVTGYYKCPVYMNMQRANVYSVQVSAFTLKHLPDQPPVKWDPCVGRPAHAGRARGVTPSHAAALITILEKKKNRCQPGRWWTCTASQFSHI